MMMGNAYEEPVRNQTKQRYRKQSFSCAMPYECTDNTHVSKPPNLPIQLGQYSLIEQCRRPACQP
jgi:hypothetical protein